MVDHFRPNTSWLTPIARGALSHAVRSAYDGGNPTMLTTNVLERFKENASLPSAAVQAANLIRLIGQHESTQGEGYLLTEATPAQVGTLNRKTQADLVSQLLQKGWLFSPRSGTRINRAGQHQTAAEYKLTLEGWERFEAEKKGRFKGSYGFIAMKFGDERLDALVSTVIKPAVYGAIGFEVVDLRDVARAGVIDNIMRAQIRDAAFVLVDLTHDNYGAYWEAGYAEGLGKPVIYICEQQKFAKAQSHFDTNHCTTVMWNDEESEAFTANLIATLRRSLNLFATAE